MDEFEALDKSNQKTHKNCRLPPEWLSSTLGVYPSYLVNSRCTPVIHYHLTVPQLASTLWVYSSYLAPYECNPRAELGDLQLSLRVSPFSTPSVLRLLYSIMPYFNVCIGIELISSCLCAKVIIYWAINPVPCLFLALLFSYYV